MRGLITLVYLLTNWPPISIRVLYLSDIRRNLCASGLDVLHASRVFKMASQRSLQIQRGAGPHDLWPEYAFSHG